MTKQELHAQYGPKLITPLPGPKARAAVEADDRLISPSYTRSYPLVAKRGRGAESRMWTATSSSISRPASP